MLCLYLFNFLTVGGDDDGVPIATAFLRRPRLKTALNAVTLCAETSTKPNTKLKSKCML